MPADVDSGFDDSVIRGGLQPPPSKPPAGWNTIRPRPRRPTVSIDKLVVTGALDSAIVRRHLARDLSKLEDCYVAGLGVQPGLEGTSTFAFAIHDNGVVGAVTASGTTPTADACIAGVVKDTAFPLATDGNPVAVTGELGLHWR